MANSNPLVDAIKNMSKTQSSQAASSGNGRSIDSQQQAFSQALKDEPSTFKLWNPDIDNQQNSNPLLTFTPEWQEQQAQKKQEQEKPKKKGLFGITIPDGSENVWDYDATNNIIDTSMPATPKTEEPKIAPSKEEPKKAEPENPFYTDVMRAIDDAASETSTPDETADNGQTGGRFKFLDWLSNTGKAAAEGTAASLTGAQRALYEAGQKSRTAQYQEEIEQLQRDLDRAKRSYEYDKEDGMSEADLQSDLYIIEDIQRKLDAYNKVVNENVQEEATKATSELSNQLQEESAKYTEYAKAAAGDNWLGNFATDISVNALQMAGDAAMNLVAPGTSLATMGLRTFGSSAQEAEAEGATLAQQLGYGAVKGGIEIATELMFDGLAGIYGDGGADEIVEEVIRKLTAKGDDATRTVLRVLFGGIGEAVEEGVSGAADPLAKSIYKGIASIPESYNKEQASEVLYDMLVGFAMGGGFSTVGIATGNNAAANAELRDTDAIQAGLEASGIDEETAEQAAPVIKKVESGQELTRREKNILLEIRNREDVAAGSNETANALTETLETQEEASPTIPQSATQESTVPNLAKAAQLETEMDTARENEATTSASTPAQAEERTDNTNKMARLETELDTAQENQTAPATETTETIETAPATTQTNEINQNKAAQIETELDKRSERIAEIQQEIADLEQQPPSQERNDEILRLVEEQTQLTQENAAEGQQENPLIQQEETETAQETETAPETEPVAQEKTAQTAEEETAEEQNAPAVEREITPEMEEAERAANNTADITEGEQNRIENVLNKAIQAREEASAKAAQTTIPDNTPVDQTKRTTVQTANKADVRKAARSLITEEESSANTVEVSNKLQQLADYVIQNDGSSIDYDAVERMAGDIADTILDGATIEIDSGAKATGQAVKDYLKTTPLRLDPSYKSDVSGDFSDFAKKYRGRIKFSDSGIGVDVAYMELADMFPGYFPEDITHPADQLIQIADVLDEAEPQLVNRYDVDNMYDQAHAELTGQILDTVLSDVIKQSAPTFADKMYAKLDALKANDAKKLKELREQKNARMKEIREQAAEAKREAVAKEKAAKWKKVKEVQDYYQGVIERSNSKRKSAGIRKKLKGLAKDISNRLTKPREGHYVPQDLVKAAVELLQDLDFDTGSESSSVRIDKLQSAYRQLMADPVYGSVMTDEVIQSRLDQLAEYVGGTRVIDMSLEQLQAVYDVVSNLAKNIDESVKIKIKGEEYNAFTLSEALRQEVSNAKSWGKNRLTAGANAWYSSAVLRPMTFLERLGGFVKNSKWSEVADMLNEGQRLTTEQIVKGSQKFADLTSDDDTASLRDTVSIGKDAAGNDIEISKGMRAALYMHLMNEDNTRHIKYGGLTIPGIEDYYKGNNDSGFGTSHTRALGISPELAKLQHEYREIAREYQSIDSEETKDAEWQKRIDDVVERMDAKEAEIDALFEAGEDYIARLKDDIERELTPIERRWIDTAREYLDEMQNTLNDTTLDVYGFKKALVQNYFPIITDPNFRAANFESIAKDMSLENSGFMKNRVTAANPMLLLDISEVVNRYMDNSAKYVGLMPAIRQFNKLYGKSQSGFAESLKDTIASKYGSKASTYIENLIADLTGARKSGDDFLSPFFAKARGHMAQAALSLNPRVALSQAASYINAASEIGWSPLLKAFNGESNPAKDASAMELVTKWSPLEYYRSMGYSTTELGDVKSDSRIENRAMKKLGFAMKWIEMVDTHTVGRLWYAAEAYTQQMNPNLEVGSDEYYQETAKTFNRVVERTQPNYTVMQRPGILRSTSDITKSLTMFMTQRLQNFNILYEAGQRFAQYESDFRDGKNDVTEADLEQARTDLANAVTSQVFSTAMLVAIKAGVDALLHSVKGYRDDDDELTSKSVMSKIADMYADAMLGNLLGGSELFSIGKSLVTGQRYYGISLSGVDSFSDLLNDIVNASTASEEQKAAKWGEAAKSLAQFFGIPANNAMNIVNGIKNHAEDIANGNFGQFVAGTDYKTSPNTVTDNDGNKYTLSSEEQKAYSDRYTEYRDSLYEAFRNSKKYADLSEDQIKKIESELNSIAKDNAKSGYFNDNGIDYSSDVQMLLGGKDAPGTANDKTALSSSNIVDYVVFKNGFNDSVKNKDYTGIDKYIKEYYRLNKNTKTVLSERDSELRNLLKYDEIGVGSKSYYAVDESINKAKVTLDKSSEGSDVKMLGLVNADIPESERAKIIRGIDGFVSKAMKNSYDVLSGYGFSSKQVYDFFSEADYRVNKQTGEVVTSGKGQLDAAEAAYGISKLPGLTDKQRSAIFNEMKKSMSNYYNDWKNYTYTSEMNYIKSGRSKYSYGKGGTKDNPLLPYLGNGNSSSSSSGSGGSTSAYNMLLDALRKG